MSKQKDALTVLSSQPAVSQRSNKAPEIVSASTCTATPTIAKGLCYDCGRPGQWSRHCPNWSKEKAELTEELEQLLANSRLQKEQGMLKETAKEKVACIKMAQEQSANPAVGPLLYLDLNIEGVQVVLMVDCGSPSTITSLSLLHRTAQQMKSDGKPLPELSIPSVQLFGKDGHEINITAQVDLQIQKGGKEVTIPVFVQPNSYQDCWVLMLLYHWGYNFWTVNGSPYKLYRNLSQILGLKKQET